MINYDTSYDNDQLRIRTLQAQLLDISTENAVLRAEHAYLKAKANRAKGVKGSVVKAKRIAAKKKR